MRSLLVGLAGLVLAGCTDLVEYYPGPEHSIGLTPHDHATNAGATPIVVRLGAYGGDDVLPKFVKTVVDEVSLRDAAGQPVPITVETGDTRTQPDGGASSVPRRAW
ncbi:MAG: hypothetical protein QM765_09610 [Myxococcales bacterium]